MKDLVRAAKDMVKRAHAPYSKFRVGAAIETKDGKIFKGCNVENASYGLSICAERSAVSAAVAAGETEFVRIAVATSSGKPTAPCGACRQVLAEFAGDLEVILLGSTGTETTSLVELLPRAFRRGRGGRPV